MRALKIMIKMPIARCFLLFLMLNLSVPAALAEQKFPTREAAVDALVDAVESQDLPLIYEILGPEYAEFQRGQQSDPALTNLRGQNFLAATREFRSFIPLGDDRYTLVIGSMAWPFPIPIVHSEGFWYFDGTTGVEELIDRIIGANELNAIALLDVFAAAQQQYSQNDHDGDGVLEYAQRVVSTTGTRDGLYWDPDLDDAFELPSPLDLLKQLSDAMLGERQPGAPFLGYYFRILYAQGEFAKAGAYDYLINGHLLGGYAMVAWPAEYGETGLMSFIVNQDRVIYQSDLGEDTAELVASMTRFDPGPEWAEVHER